MQKQIQQPDQWYLYVRKSTDEEGKQVLSLEAQLAELQEFAQRENVEIAETFIEKKTAKVPGRPVFNEMLSKMENGSRRTGILSWAPDRLSRNSVDAGKIIFLLDTGKIASLKFPTFAFENNPSGKFFLSIGLSNAKYYIDSLAENVRRGNRAKLRRGEWPGFKPVGYIYDHRLRNIVPDPKKAEVIKNVFEEFATGRHGYKSISKYLADFGVKSKNGDPRSNFNINKLLTNEIYIGIMKWDGEVYEGKYQPLISKQLFDSVQEVLENKSKPRKVRGSHSFPFCGLFKCSCGSMMSAQWAKGHGGLYRYYRCTRKKGKCGEPYIQESYLQSQIIEKIKTIALPDNWTNQMLEYLDQEKKNESKSAGTFVQEINTKIALLQIKLDKLLEIYLDNLIDEETYRIKKEKIIEQKNSLKSEKTILEQKRMSGWIEPTINYIKTLEKAKNINDETELPEISQFVEKIGTNRLISNKNVSWNFLAPYDFTVSILARSARLRSERRVQKNSKFSLNPIECPGEDSNLHAFRHMLLRHACLPIPPPGHK